MLTIMPKRLRRLYQTLPFIERLRRHNENSYTIFTFICDAMLFAITGLR
ncbi:hypothetical protein CRENPOLYSF2_1390035 [Crenothrix polyspora]|uniref:Transposase n=1 Tax=Crenothrix polyspora TaxID=360316 RepID=A0A1R4H152_9GAMM|nr:hypothetical protein CRENPOLYSF2_1390035 [Crenothrix polyspora]